jgi:endonuclease YncB( thermonuclease family)
MIAEDFRPTYKYPPAEVIRILDGDTIEVELPMPCDIRYRATLRLIGYDADEMTDADPGRRARAVAARDYLASLVGGVLVYVETYKERRSFTRYTARAFIEPINGDPNLVSLSDLLLASGLVVPWP